MGEARAKLLARAFAAVIALMFAAETYARGYGVLGAALVCAVAYALGQVAVSTLMVRALRTPSVEPPEVSAESHAPRPPSRRRNARGRRRVLRDDPPDGPPSGPEAS